MGQGHHPSWMVSVVCLCVWPTVESCVSHYVYICIPVQSYQIIGILLNPRIAAPVTRAESDRPLQLLAPKQSSVHHVPQSLLEQRKSKWLPKINKTSCRSRKCRPTTLRTSRLAPRTRKRTLLVHMRRVFDRILYLETLLTVEGRKPIHEK